MQELLYQLSGLCHCTRPNSDTPCSSHLCQSVFVHAAAQHKNSPVHCPAGQLS